jgi:hypothetical protein
VVNTLANPLFLLQIVEVGGPRAVAQIPGGGALEADLIDICTRTILSKGVGLFKTEAHVEQDIRDGLAEAIMGLKAQTRFIV